MATGYTAAIEDGISFQDFVLRCARAMGACIMQRDEPLNAPIKMDEPSGYYKVEGEKAFRELAMFSSMDLASREQVYRESIRSRESALSEIKVGHSELRAKYDDMLQKVNEWEPPTEDHVGLKEFMQEQIAESMSFDCYDVAETQPPTFEEWQLER